MIYPTKVSSQEITEDDFAINTNNYKTAIGIRAGGTSGLTIKHFTTGSTAIEGIVGVWNHGFSGTVLYEKYSNAFDAPGLNWYYGAGGHISVATYSYWNDTFYDGYRYNTGGEVGLGVDGIVGLEYKINPIPFAVSLDAKPFVEVVSEGSIGWSIDPALGIKLTF